MEKPVEKIKIVETIKEVAVPKEVIKEKVVEKIVFEEKVVVQERKVEVPVESVRVDTVTKEVEKIVYVGGKGDGGSADDCIS